MSSPASRSRPTAARPGIRRTSLAPTRPVVNWTYTLGRRRLRRRRRSRLARSTTAATSRHPSDAISVNVSCPCSIWGNSVTPADRRHRRHQLGQRRSEVPVLAVRLDHRNPLLQGRRRTPARTSAASGPRAGSCSHRPRSRTRRHPAGRPSRSRNRSRSCPTRPTSSPTSRRPGTSPATGSYFYPYGAVAGRRCRLRQPAAARGPQQQQRQRPLHVRRDERVPDEHLPGRQLLGRPGVHSDPGARPGDQRVRDRRLRLRDRQLVRADERRRADHLHGHAVHRLDGPDADDRHRHPSTSVTINNLQQGTAYTFKVQASNPTRCGAHLGSRRIQSRRPDPRRRPRRPASPRLRPPGRRWSAGRRRTPTAARSPPTRSPPTSGRARRRRSQVLNGSATSATVTGLTTGTSYTFTVSATNALGTGPASTASSAVDARGHDLRLWPRPTPSTPEMAPLRTSASSSPPTRAGRSSGSASTRRPPTPAPTSAAYGPRAARSWRPRRSRTRPRPAGRRSCSPVPSRSPPARPTSRATSTPTATTRSTAGVQLGGRQPAAARGRQQHDAETASTTTARPAPSRPVPTTPPTTGSTSCSSRRRPARSRTSRRPPGTSRRPSAGPRRPVAASTELHGHAVHRQHGADADDDQRQLRRPPARRSRPAARDRLHVHGSGVERPRLRSSLGGVELRDADGADRAGCADRRRRDVRRPARR